MSGIALFILIMIASNLEPTKILSFKGQRLHRSASILIEAPVDKAFPLFGPVREKEWATGWEPEIIFTNDAWVEEHMIFQTKGQETGEKYIWAVTTYQPEKYLIEYTVLTNERIWFIRVACASQGDKTSATISYTYTGLTDEGNRKNKLAIEKMFNNDLSDWEEAINYYLKTGQLLIDQ
jgi:hypothetical protein